jgi:outer membrane protein
MKKMLALAILFALAAGAANAAPPPQPPLPKIVVIDRSAIMRFSKAGQDIARQVQMLANQAKADLTAQGRSLQTEEAQLQQQIAILAPDVKQRRIAEFEEKRNALQGLAQRKEAMIQGGVMQAQRQMEQVLAPILQQIIQERGANLVLDKQAVVFASNSAFDITPDAINRLNGKLSSVKVSLVNPPPGAPK